MYRCLVQLQARQCAPLHSPILQLQEIRDGALDQTGHQSKTFCSGCCHPRHLFYGQALQALTNSVFGVARHWQACYWCIAQAQIATLPLIHDSQISIGGVRCGRSNFVLDPPWRLQSVVLHLFLRARSTSLLCSS